mgnify:CR=1 FL=1
MISQKTYTVDEALQKMQNYCSYQERCHKEVRQKLKEMRMIPEAIDHIVTALIQHDFLNESRYAKAFVRGKFRIKHWGKRRLILELRKRDISKFNINLALQEITDADYLETFDKLAEKKYQAIQESNKLKMKKKLADYLLYRGWESHLVYDKVNELIH